MYKNPKKWDLALAQAKFSYNDTRNRSTGMRECIREEYMSLDIWEKQEIRIANAEEFIEKM